MRLTLHRSALSAFLFLLLIFSILWKGGKALDAVWMLSLVACGITLLHAFFLSREEKQAPATIPWFLALFFLFWTILSFLQSTTKNYGLDEVMQTASLFLIFQIALSVPDAQLENVRSRSARIIAFSALIACGIGMVVYTLQPVSRFVGTFFDARFSTDYWPNAWAEFLLFAWPPMVWALWGRKQESRAHLLKIFVMGFLLSCLLLSYSRGAILVFCMQIVLCTMLFVRRGLRGNQCRKFFTSALSIIAVSILFFVLSNHLRSNFHAVESVAKKATFTSDEGTSSVSERRQFWSQALTFIQQKPLFGFGPYSFRFLQPHIQTDVLATSDHPHNVFLKLAMERGVAAAVLFALLVCICLIFGGKESSGKRVAGSGDVLHRLIVVSVSGVLLHNLIDYNLQFVGIALPFWLGLGLLPNRRSLPSKFSFAFTQTLSVVIALALLLLTLIEGRYLLFSSLARRAERSGNYPQAMLRYALTDDSLFPRDGWLSRAGILLAKGTPDAAQEAINHEMNLNSQDYRIWKLQGDLFLQQKNNDKALEAFWNAYHYGRYNDLGITRVLVELLRSGRKNLDLHRHEFELLMDDFGLAIEQDAHFIDLSTNVEELSKLCTLFAEIYPSDASVYRSLQQRSEQHAALERSRLTGRPRGYLW